MQQIALPSIYNRRGRAVLTPPFPLVRRTPRDGATRGRARKFAASLLFGALMSTTLVLLGYEARLFWDQHPNLGRDALQAMQNFRR
ncbi:MAG TPA: hypothetical protein VF103_16775 [Polyangiaceae bacterium]